jgi:pantoate--beta-alanine ligase
MVADNFEKKSIPELNAMVANCFKESSLILEYFEIANEKTLKTAQRKRKNNTYRGFIAAFAGEVRLIDNYRLN